MRKIIKHFFIFWLYLITTVSWADSKPTEYLFIQTAALGEMHFDAENNAYQLILHKVDPWVIYFSNVPKRETGFTKLGKFIESFNKEVKERHKKGLNAGIVAFDIKKRKMLRYTFSLSEPVYNRINHTVKFTAHALPGEQEDLHPDVVFEHAALFIDACPACDGSSF